MRVCSEMLITQNKAMQPTMYDKTVNVPLYVNVTLCVNVPLHVNVLLYVDVPLYVKAYPPTQSPTPHRHTYTNMQIYTEEQTQRR